MNENFPDLKISVEDHIMPRIKDLIIDCILSVKNQLNPNRRKDCFELFGYDFLIDEDFRVWLIEVNTNPYFGIPNDYIADLLPKMIDDMTKIVVDPIFPPKFVDNERENLFELLYSETENGLVLTNKRRPFNFDLVYPHPELRPPIGVVKKAALAKVRMSKYTNLYTERRRCNLEDIKGSNYLKPIYFKPDKYSNCAKLSKLTNNCF